MPDKPAYEELEFKIKVLEGSLAKHMQTEEKLLYRVKIEALVSKISTSFINIPSEKMDDYINSSLRLLGEFAGVDRSYVFLFYDNGLKMDNTHEWCGQGIEPQIENLKGLTSDMFPWWMQQLRNKEHIHINRLQDLPPEADAEKGILQSQDIQSVIVVPLEYKDDLVGFLGFDSVKEEKNWIEQDILLLKTIGDIFVGALKRKESEEALERRLEFERLVTEISSDFVGLGPEEMDKGINRALSLIGTFSGADRAYVFHFHNHEITIDNTHEWCAHGVESQIHNLKNIPIEKELPWFAKQIRKNEVFHVPVVDEMPAEAYLEQSHFQAQGIKSLIVVPMKLGDRMIGFVGFDAVQKLLIWTEDDKILLRIIGEIFTHVTERKKAEEEQERMQAQISNSVEIARLGPWEYDVENDLFIFNDYFYKIHRTTVEQMGGYTMSAAEYFLRFTHPNDMPLDGEQFRKLMETNDPSFRWQNEHRIIFGDGTEGYISTLVLPIKDAKGRIIKAYGVNQDITEQKLAMERLRESEDKLARSKKMESLGLLAGGVAHDLNNVLSGIVSYPELLLMDLPEDSILRKPIETIQESGNKAVAIIQDLLTIARGVASPKKPLNINDVVNEYLTSPEFNELKRLFPSMRVKTYLDDELVNIQASFVHIRKTIMALVMNASEAIQGAGNISISTFNRYVAKPIRGYEDVKIGEYVVLSVSDNGPGISPKNFERIFEPFFIKKKMGRSGTGLGLAVVWNVVQDHAGYVDVKSDETGTTFELYFPISRDESMDWDLPGSIEELKGSDQTVLVVDDMESQRDISCAILDALGYKCITVSSGEEAVEYLKNNQVDIVLLDMIMDPGMNGLETYKNILKIHPGQKAIIVSGFAESDDVKAAQKMGARQFVRKPLTLGSIGIAIKKELGN